MQKKDTALYLPLVLAGIVLVLFGFFALRGASGQAGPDKPPSIEFTWESADEPVSLREFEGKLVMSDDRGLDFTAYRMEIAETGTSYDLPIDGLSGKRYEQDIYFAWLAENADVAAAKKATVTFAIKDDAGQESSLTREIPLR